MNEYNLEEIHETLLQFLEEFDKICVANHIPYYLMGGSALGATRHNGFIPWDDDVDVFMTYHSYQKFMQVCQASLDNDLYYFEKQDTKAFPFFYSKLKRNGTTFIEEDFSKFKQMHHGFFIDIMCLYGTSSLIPIRFLQYSAASLLKMNSLYQIGFKRNCFWKMWLLKLSNICVNKVTKPILYGIVKMYGTRNTKYVGHFFGRARFVKTSFKREYLGTPTYVQFENKFFPVPENVDGYLKVRYGNDYMKMPSQKVKDSFPSHAFIVDPNVDYSFYVKGKQV